MLASASKQYLCNTNRLTVEQLKQLFDKKILALRVPNYLDKEACDILSKKILENMELGFYENAPNIGRIGKAFYETTNNPTSELFYFDNASKWVSALRAACSPFISPIDSLRVMLDDIWPKGCTIATMNQKKMFVGLTRYFTEQASAEPHQDIIKRDAPNTSLAEMVKAQLAFNVYLSLPEAGGQLELWDWVASDSEFTRYQDSREDFSYAFQRSLIPQSHCTITPRLGELILFNSNNVHAVTPSEGERLSVSCFIGYCGDNKPLVLWS